MSTKLRREFLELLNRDVEFRYMVAGYLGLSEILKRLDGIEREQAKIWEEVRSLREGQNRLLEGQSKLWEEVRMLREGQGKLWEEVKFLREGQNRLWEEVRMLGEGQNRLWEEVKFLREDQSKLWEEVRSLREGQNRLWEEVRMLREGQGKLWEEVRVLREVQNRLLEGQVRLEGRMIKLERRTAGIEAYIEKTSVSLEEEAWEVVGRVLGSRGVSVKLSRLIVPGFLELNIYGVADDLCVVGEVSTRLGVKLVRRVDRSIRRLKDKYPELLKPKMVKVLYTLWATQDAIEEARKRKIWLLKTVEELTRFIVIKGV